MAWRGKNPFFQSNTPAAIAKRTYKGIKYDSLAELARYRDHLEPLLQFGHIKDYQHQPRFYLDFLGHRYGFYTSDFQYSLPDGTMVIEEIKGKKENREFSLKWKIVQVLYPQYKWVFLRSQQRGIKFTFTVVKRVAAKLKSVRCQ